MGSLWPEDFGKDEIKAPYIILREQAEILAETFDQVILGKINNIMCEHYINFCFNFQIIAPSLGNYQFWLFNIYYDLDYYPLRILIESDTFNELYPDEERERLYLDNETEFLEVLKRIFNSNNIKKIIRALITLTD